VEKLGTAFVKKHKVWIRDAYPLPLGQEGEWKMKSKQLFRTIFNQAELSLSTLSTNRWKLKTVMSAVKT